ncbi:MAG TPA: VOC family protein [Pyrinomonadaceae bacterium]|jgi:predicted 3-demethylubiquinone-9 3-methyltransferase (glyoxalase superfamily)|nr:VOC family protein [Pyrinomonadaceae bacterium]
MAATNPAPTGAAAKARDERTQPRTQKITTFLWFDGNAEEAVNFYVSIFKNSKVLKTLRNGDAGPGPKGTPLTISFELDGQEFTALNGGPQFKFTEAVSQVVHCDTQEEVDYFWERLSEGGEKVECGWLKDKFGMSWQITPDILLELLQDSDQQKSQRVMKAMMTMKKIDIKGIEQAAAGN